MGFDDPFDPWNKAMKEKEELQQRWADDKYSRRLAQQDAGGDFQLQRNFAPDKYAYDNEFTKAKILSDIIKKPWEK